MTKVDKLPGKISRLSLVSHQNFLYLLGGLKGSRNSFQSVGNFWRFDQSQGKWQKIVEITPLGKITGHTAVNVVGNIYYFGGVFVNQKQSKKIEYKNHFWEFNIAEQKWRQLTEGPSARYHAGITTDNKNHIYVYGGHNDSKDSDLGNLWRYSISDNHWQIISKIDVGNKPAMAFMKDKIYITGERNYKNQNNDLAIYNTKSNQWHYYSQTRDDNFMYQDGLAIENRFCFIGGATNDNPPGELNENIYCFNENKAKFEKHNQFNQQNFLAGGYTLSDDKIFLYGGRDIANINNDHFSIYCIQQKKYITLP